MQQPDFTLTAGPISASPRTLAALGSPIVFDYDPVFLERFAALERKVAALYGETRNDIVLMQGEAVLGLEAAARSLVRPGMVCLNLASGVYGKWFGRWLAEYGAELVELEVPYDEAIDPEAVERAFRERPEIELLAVVHSETPSGTANPIDEICPIAKRHGALTIVDCVSSLGGAEVRPDDWGLDLCVAGPQKCLSGPPGMSLVAVSADAWAAIRANPAAPRGSFLSLTDWKDTWIDGGRTRFPYTPSVAEVHGVSAACDDVLEEGLAAVIERHDRAAAACRAGIRAMGLAPWAKSDAIATNCVTAVRKPEGAEIADILAHARERYGVMLSAGYGELKPKLLRIGHMGVASRSLNVVVGLSALGRTLADLGVPVRTGDGVEAALEVLATGAGVGAAA
ncbi:MAG: alanine--glyoxylate aminotransferase family protein [Thermoleophilia bacterium]|nr:alanine--glyoxylate aminotransferase family protein [Thermoleophilia bacterium]